MNPPSRLPFLFERPERPERPDPCDPGALKKRAAFQIGTAAGRAKQPRRPNNESALERLAASIVEPGRQLSSSPTAAARARHGGVGLVVAPAPAARLSASSSASSSSSVLASALAPPAPILASVDARGPRVFGQPRAAATAAAAAAGGGQARPRPASTAPPARAPAAVAAAATATATAVAAIAGLRLPPGDPEAAAIASIAAAVTQLPQQQHQPRASRGRLRAPTTTREPRQHLLEAAQQSALERRGSEPSPDPIRMDEYYSHYDDGGGFCDGVALGIAGSAPPPGSDGMAWEGQGRTTLGARHLGD